MNATNTVTMSNDDVTTAARAAFAASKLAGNDDGAALDDVNETIRGLVGSRTGTLDQESLTWTFDESAIAIEFDSGDAKGQPNAARLPGGVVVFDDGNRAVAQSEPGAPLRDATPSEIAARNDAYDRVEWSAVS